MLLLLTHLAALALLWAAPRFWVALDVKAFSADPASDTFHATFHSQRLTWRLAFLVAVAALASLPLLLAGHRPAAACHFLALVALGTAYFFYDFNPRLNRARNLPYVGPYYVSSSPTAARFPDRWLWARAQRRWPVLATMSPDKMNRIWQDCAARRLQELGRWALETGIILYIGFLLIALLLCVPL